MKTNYNEPIIQIMPFQFQPIFQHKEQWITSDYGCNGERLINQQVRKSSYQFAIESGIISLPLQNHIVDKKWRLIKYENGKFIEHEDKKHFQNHFGTQIIVFPKYMSPHTKGQLIIYNPNNKNQSIKVQAQQFTYIYVYIPLGINHEITEINGIRIVATRMVLSDNKLSEYQKQQKMMKQHQKQLIKQGKKPRKKIVFD